MVPILNDIPVAAACVGVSLFMLPSVGLRQVHMLT